MHMHPHPNDAHGTHPDEHVAAANRAHQSLAMNLSLAIAALMLIGKTGAFLISGSTAILSDAAESVVHIVATGVAALSLHYSRKPADDRYLYGYGKVVFFSIGIEGALIFSAAIAILFEAISALIHGPQLQDLGWGIAITGALGLLNLALGVYLVYTGKKTHSPVLVANGQHVLTDMWTSLAVVTGVTVVYFTKILWLDPIIAILAALQIIYTGSNLLRESFALAMDRAVPEDTEKLKRCLDQLVEEKLISGYHQLRHRKVNNIRWIELHMLVEGSMTVSEAHGKVTAAEHRLEEVFHGERVLVTTHIEPKDHTPHHQGHTSDPLFEING